MNRKKVKLRRSRRIIKGQKILTVIRKVIKIGNSYYIALPKEWMNEHNIKEGDEIPIIADYSATIYPIPKIITEEEKERIIFEGDNNE